jgi:hypothetical protein
VRVWDLATSKQVNQLVPDGNVPIRDVSVAEDAKCVVAANQNAEVFVWRPETSAK